MKWTYKGKFFGSLCVVLFLLSLQEGMRDLFVPFSFVFSLFLVSYLFFPSNLDGISIERTLSTTSAMVGEEVQVSLRVKNNSGKKMFFEVWDTIPGPLKKTGGEEYISTRMNAKRITNFSYSVECYQRGIHDFGPVRTRTSDPFGFFVNESEIPVYSKFSIFPKFISISRLSGWSTTHGKWPGFMNTPLRGGTGEFHRIRDFQNSDNLKDIHWKSTAKMDQLMVKEYEQTLFPDFFVVIDGEKSQNIGIGNETTFEYMIHTASTLIFYLLEHGGRVGVMMTTHPLEKISAGKGRLHFEKIMQMFTAVEANGGIPLHGVLNGEISRFSKGITILILTSRLDWPIEKEIVRYLTKGYHVIFFLFEINSFIPVPENDQNVLDLDKNIQNKLISRGVPVYVIRKGSNLANIFSLTPYATIQH